MNDKANLKCQDVVNTNIESDASKGSIADTVQSSDNIGFDSESKYKTQVLCCTLSETLALAARFAEVLMMGNSAVVLFKGMMGAGKTTFISAVVRIMQPSIIACSPTFTIVNQYCDNIYHLDLYRISGEEELGNTAFDEIVQGENFVFIEWSEKCTRHFGGRVFEVNIEVVGEEQRRFEIHER